MSVNPVVRKRRIALHPLHIAFIFLKGYVNSDDIAILYDHQLTKDRQSGLDPLSKAHYKRECTDSIFGVGRILPGRGFPYHPRAMINSTLWIGRSDFYYTWSEAFTLELPFITIHFLAYTPPSFDEVHALRTTTNALLHLNRLLQQRNEELAHRNAELEEQVRRLSTIIGMHLNE